MGQEKMGVVDEVCECVFDYGNDSCRSFHPPGVDKHG